MDLRKASLDDKVKVCSTYYKWGFAFLPWLWCVSYLPWPLSHTHTRTHMQPANHVFLSVLCVGEIVRLRR